MPYVSTEALVGAALLVVLAFGYQHITISGTDTTSPAKKKKKNNKKKGKWAVTEDAAPITVASGSEAETKSSKNKKKNKGKQQAAAKESQPTPPPATTPQPSAPEPDSDEPKSFAEAAQEDGPQEPRKPKMLAEKLLPKPRKTKVDE